jgi:hypothetical protein
MKMMKVMLGQQNIARIVVKKHKSREVDQKVYMRLS